MAQEIQTLIIAHRGESRDAPENTLAAINLAWKRGARAVEIDTRLSADGHLMVFHDANTRRIGGRRRTFSSQTAAELRSLDAGSWMDQRWRGERIPFLRDVVATIPRGGRLFIEIKGGPEHVPPLAALIEEMRPAPGSIVVMSFDTQTMAAAASALPRVEKCLLLTAAHFRTKRTFAAACALAREMRCASIDIERHRCIDRALVETAQGAGLKVYVWTVDRVSTARRLVRAGIDGITTNGCARMREKLGFG